MLDKIYHEIETSDFIIADLSDKNPNVFYELGYAHALGKLCILITKSADNIPFDLKHKRHIVYSSLSSLKSEIGKNIEWVKSEISNAHNNPFQVELKTDGTLETTETFARANLEFQFDIENRSNKVSPEIQAVYLYSYKEWEIKQNGNKVPSKKSDLKPFGYKYQLGIETLKIPKNGWTQIELKISKVLANSWVGQEIKENYTIQGNVLLEIATNKGVFTTKHPINVYIDTLPFLISWSWFVSSRNKHKRIL